MHCDKQIPSKRKFDALRDLNTISSTGSRGAGKTQSGMVCLTWTWESLIWHTAEHLLNKIVSPFIKASSVLIQIESYCLSI